MHFNAVRQAIAIRVGIIGIGPGHQQLILVGDAILVGILAVADRRCLIAGSIRRRGLAAGHAVQVLDPGYIICTQRAMRPFITGIHQRARVVAVVQSKRVTNLMRGHG